MTDQLFVTLHDHPRDQTKWLDRVSTDTLAALIDKLGGGQRLYFTTLGHEWRVISLEPDTARFGMVGGTGCVDLQGHEIKSRGTLVAEEIVRAHDARVSALRGKPPGAFLIKKERGESGDLDGMRQYDDVMHAYLCGDVGRAHLLGGLPTPPPPYEHVEHSMADRLGGGPELSRDFDDSTCGRCGYRRCDHPPSDDCHGGGGKKFTNCSVDGTWPVWITPHEAQCLLPALATAAHHDEMLRQLWSISRTEARCSARVQLELEDARHFLNMMRGSRAAHFPEAQMLIAKLEDAKTQLENSLLREICNLPEGYDLRCEDTPGEEHALRVRGYRPVHAGHFWQGLLRSWVLAGNEARSHARLTETMEEVYTRAEKEGALVTVGSHPDDSRGGPKKSDENGLKDFQFIGVSLIPADQVVYPHPVGRILCNDCSGSGKRVQFQLPEDCDACEGTGWMGGKIKIKGSSENEMETAPGKTSPPESEKGEI